MRVVEIDGNSLTIEQFIAVSRKHARVKLGKGAKERIQKSREVIEKIIASSELAYGIKTGFGELCQVAIPQEDRLKLQENLVRSHACAVGAPLPEEIVRGIILLRANTFAKGYSGVRPELVNLLIEMLNRNIVPVIYEQGSVGASGDLAPLAMMALALIGEGEVFYRGERRRAAEVFAAEGLEPLRLDAKEGLALINGTSVMTSIAGFAIHESEVLLKTGMVACMMSLEALKGTNQAFRKEVSEVRKHAGQKNCAEIFMRMLEKSEILESHKNCKKVQDAYTLRCAPQVLGAVWDTLDYAKKIVEIEMNSVTDNPLILPEGKSLSCGNFHGEPVAFVMDFLAIALTAMGNFSERRIARLVDTHLSGLPPFLTEKSGLNSGYMIPQYVAASLASENKILAHPASADTISTSANQEDHVSMGTTAARKCLEICRNVRYILAIEILCASQGIDFHRPLKPGIGVLRAWETVRKYVPHLEEDRVLYPEIQKIAELIGDGEFVRVVEREIGKM
ncbi:MAG: histidine ammonia-lyase [Thermoplasmata archaeon]|nr:histidine ammonia-lyase [Thermoplasmata archaeon]